MCLSLPKAVCFIRRLYSSPSFNQRPPAKDVYNVLEAGVYRGLARYAWLRMVRNQEEVSAASDDFRLTEEKGLVETSAAVVAIEAEQAAFVMPVGRRAADIASPS